MAEESYIKWKRMPDIAKCGCSKETRSHGEMKHTVKKINDKDETKANNKNNNGSSASQLTKKNPSAHTIFCGCDTEKTHDN